MQPQQYSTTQLNTKYLEIRGRIQQSLGVHKFKSNGFSALNIKCLFHEDRHPSASLHVEKGLYCHACAQWFTWKQLAGKVGVEWNFSGGSQRVQRYLPDEVIQKLVARKRVRACQVLSELYGHGLEGEVVAVRDLVAMTECSHETVARMADEGFLIYSAYLPTYNNTEVGKQAEKIGRGRKPKYVRVPALEKLEKLLRCDKSRRHYSLEVGDDVKELKAEVVSLPVKRAPNKTLQRSTKYFGKAAGMKSPKTVRKYLKMVTKSEPDAEARPLTIAELNAMPETHKEYIENREKGSGWMYLSVGERKFAYHKPQALLAVGLAGSLESVTVHTQRANIYHYTGIPQMSEEVAGLVESLKAALVIRKMETRKSEWASLMDELDAKILEQKEQERVHLENQFKTMAGTQLPLPRRYHEPVQQFVSVSHV